MNPVGPTTAGVLRFDIEGREVQCYQSGGHRLWRCECEDFQRMLTKHREGFCPHVAVAIWQIAQSGARKGRTPLDV